jgi:hypothetical protein
MKKYTSIFVAAAFLSVSAFVFVPAVHAEDQTEAQLKQMELQYEAQKKAAEGLTEAQKREMEQNYETQKREVENAREAQKQEIEENREAAKTAAESMDDNDSEDENEDEDEGERHRSVVAEFVHSLDAAASSTSRGIGEQVREVAREQNELKDKTAENLKSLESRTAFIQFLIGSNRESIKALEDSAAVMQSHMDTLTQIEANTSPEVGKVLAAQVKLLAKEKARIQSTIDAHKNNTGIFGWLIGMF